eukprot:Anaeramoba_flamelloidesa348204_6.p2 GENE.a348204_6~~a348204_6.p2  ORF type:complete len:110 (-),score=1.12 a348204_6:49-378(-)
MSAVGGVDSACAGFAGAGTGHGDGVAAGRLDCRQTGSGGVTCIGRGAAASPGIAVRTGRCRVDGSRGADRGGVAGDSGSSGSEYRRYHFRDGAGAEIPDAQSESGCVGG